MQGLICREATPDDVHDVLKVRNAIFPPVTPQQWLADPDMTCSIAYLDGEPVGAIPLSLREFQVAPGAIIRTAFENAVGTREDMRSRGIGTAVIKQATEFLAGRCDELMVYRGAERSEGYRFYLKSGHRDLVYLRQMALARPQPREADVAVQGIPELCASQAELLACFEATYGRLGGFPRRHEGYWEHQLRSLIYDVLPQETLFVRHPAQGALRAYALAGRRLPEEKYSHISTMEVAGLTEADIEQALFGLEDVAARRKLAIHALISTEDPLRPILRRLGYEEHVRSTMIMGQPITPRELFGKVCTDPGVLDDFKIDFWAPFGDGTLHEGPNATHEITLEGKDEAIYRLLNRRLDIRAAVRTEWLTLRNGTEEAVERLAIALPYSPWAYHHLDYI